MSLFSVLKSIVTLPYRAIKACIEATTNFIRSIFEDEADVQPATAAIETQATTTEAAQADAHTDTPVDAQTSVVDTVVAEQPVANVVTPMATTGAANFVSSSELVKTSKGGKVREMKIRMWAKFSPIEIVRITANTSNESLLAEPFTLAVNTEYCLSNTNPDIRTVTIHTADGEEFVCTFPGLSRNQRKQMRLAHEATVAAAAA